MRFVSGASVEEHLQVGRPDCEKQEEQAIPQRAGFVRRASQPPGSRGATPSDQLAVGGGYGMIRSWVPGNAALRLRRKKETSKARDNEQPRSRRSFLQRFRRLNLSRYCLLLKSQPGAHHGEASSAH